MEDKQEEAHMDSLEDYVELLYEGKDKVRGEKVLQENSGDCGVDCLWFKPFQYMYYWSLIYSWRRSLITLFTGSKAKPES